jgi:hypothetical protein
MNVIEIDQGTRFTVRSTEFMVIAQNGAVGATEGDIQLIDLTNAERVHLNPDKDEDHVYFVNDGNVAEGLAEFIDDLTIAFKERGVEPPQFAIPEKWVNR